MNKEKWISLFKDIGLSDENMKLWHQQFENKYPDAHQSFLEWLHIPPEEINHIRSL